MVQMASIRTESKGNGGGFQIINEYILMQFSYSQQKITFRGEKSGSNMSVKYEAFMKLLDLLPIG